MGDSLRKLVSGLVPVVVVTCLLTVVGASPTAAQGPTAKRSGVLDVVCVDRGDGSLRAPSRACARGEDRVRVTVAERLRVRRGLLVPNNEGAWFCAAPGRGVLREIERPRQCRKGRALESRNHRPGPPVLSDTEIPAGVPIGTAIGSLTAADQDAADRMTYRLVSGAGDDDNALFDVVGGALVTASEIDLDAGESYRVRLQVTDLLGLSRSAAVVLDVVDGDENSAPTGLALDAAEIAENRPAGTVVGRLSTTDPDDADSHTYTLATEPGVANDNPLFSIVGDELRTASGLDFESRSRLSVRVRTDDGEGGRFETDLSVTVVDGPDAPAGIRLAPSTVAENLTGEVGRLITSDQDAGDHHAFALVAGAGDRDNARFAITGDRLSLVTAADFEDRSALTVRVRVTDKDGLTYAQAVAVTVTDEDEPPTEILLSPASVRENEPAGTSAGTLSVNDQDGGSGVQYALVAGAGDDDNAAFRIDGTELVTTAAFDYETDASHSVRVRATDGSGLSLESELTVSVVNRNEAATRLDLSDSTVAEDAEVDTVVGTLSTDDPDLDDPITFTLLDDAAGRFAIDGDELVTADDLDRETDASHTIEVRAADAAGERIDATFVITVDNVNEAPSAPSINDDTVDENLAAGAAVGQLAATDPDGDTVTYALVAGAGDDDNDAFQLSGSALVTAARFDHEAQATYSVRVRVTDSGTPSLSTEAVLTIHVADVNERPSDPSLSPAAIAENLAPGTLVGSLAAIDPDAGDAPTFTLVDALDSDHFQVVNGVVYALDTFDFEAESSYSIRVEAADGHGGTSAAVLTIDITDSNDAPTAVDLSDATVPENAAVVVGTLSTTDQDAGDSHTYSLPAGEADNGEFTVDGDELRATGPFDHETQPTREVLVRSTDEGGVFVEQSFTVNVQDVNEAPTAISLAPVVSFVENLAPQDAGSLSATDPEGDAMTYSLVGGAGDDDNGSFTIVGTTLRATAHFDFETQPTASVRVRATDGGGLSREQTLTVTVDDADDAPTGVTFGSGGSVAENSGIGVVVGFLDIVDVDGQGATVYSLSGAGDFQVDANGRVTTTTILDHEATPEITIQVEVGNGFQTTYTGPVTITVTDVNDAPTAIDLSSAATDENTPAGVIGTLSTTDQDAGDSHLYSLPPGEADNDEFTIDGDELRATGSFDHETQPTREVLVRSTDEGGAYVEQTFTITVDDVNEAPTAISIGTYTLPENAGARDVGTLSATDPEGGALTYALVTGAGDDDNGSFSITGSTLHTSGTFDYETQSTVSIRIRVTDAGGLSHDQVLTLNVRDSDDWPTGVHFRTGGSVPENTSVNFTVGMLDVDDVDGQDPILYSQVGGDGTFYVSSGGQVIARASLDHEATPETTITVRVMDGASITYQGPLTITVTDVNEAPAGIALSPSSVDENEEAGTAVGALSAVDPDAGAGEPTFALAAGTGDTDNARFEIIDGELVTKAAFDFEAQASYSVRVRASDTGGASSEAALTVTVNPVDEAPSITGPAAFPVDENEPVGTTVATLAATDPESDALTWSLVDGDGSDDNAKLRITSDGVLETAASYDHEAQETLHARVQVSDGTLTDERELTVIVLDVNDAPTVVADSYAGIVGNTYAKLGSVADLGPTVTLTGTLPLANDLDQDGDTISVVAATSRPTSLGGRITINADGSFRYLPPVGAKDRTDTFSYTVTDGESQNTGTISLVIGDRLVWYLGDNNGGLQTGTAQSPMVNLTTLNGANDLDGPGDQLYLFGGGFADAITLGRLTLEKDQKLIGAGVALPGILPAGSTPTSGAYLTLAEGVSIEGVDLFANSTDDTSTVTASGVDSFTIGSTTTIRNTGVAPPLSIVGGAGDITVGAAIQATGGGPVRVNSRTAGTVRFTGPISTVSTAARAISLTGNTGATVRFSGGLTLSTGSNPAFSASGGGTLEVTGTGNTITTTSGTPLSVTNTTIGAAGLTFRSISSSGAVNGIVLRNTGTSGSLDVTGSSSGACGGTLNADGSPNLNPVTNDCSGGKIASSTGVGVLLENTRAPSFTRIWVTGSGDDGVRASNVAGLTIANSNIDGNGNAVGENGVDLGGSEVTPYTGATGTVVITDSAIGGSGDTNLFSGTSSGTTTLSLLRNRIYGSATAGARDGIRVHATSGGTVDLTVTGSFLSNNAAEQVQVVSSGTGRVQRAAITRNTTWAGGRGIQVAAGGSPFTGMLAFDVADNAIRSIAGPAVAVIGTNVNGAGYVGHVRRNTIGQASAGACASAGDGVLVSTEDGAGSITVGVTNNTVTNCAGRGIALDATGGAAALNATITGNTVSFAQTPSGVEALRLDLNPQPADTGVSCVQIATNSLTAGAASANGARLRLNHTYGTLQAVTTATGNLADTYGTRLAATNPTGTGGVLAVRPITSTHTGVATCPTAPN